MSSPRAKLDWLNQPVRSKAELLAAKSGAPPTHVTGKQDWLYKSVSDRAQLFASPSDAPPTPVQPSFDPQPQAESKKSTTIEDNRYLANLGQAVLSGESKVIDEFIERYTPKALDTPIPPHGKTALCLAIQKGKTDIARKLILNGAELGLKDEYGQTPLILSCREGNLGIVNEIIKRDSSSLLIDSCDMDGRSALHYAVRIRSMEIVQALIAKGAKCDLQDINRQTPLMLACEMGRIDLVTELIAKGGVNLLDKSGHTALFYAAKSRNPKVTEKLINASDANGVPLLNLPTKDIVTLAQMGFRQQAFMHAIKSNDADTINNVIRIAGLASAGMFNTPDITGQTPLMLAIKMHNPSLVRYLLQNGANIVGNGADPYPPFSVAAEHDYVDIVRHFFDKSCPYGKNVIDRFIDNTNTNTDQAKQVVIKAAIMQNRPDIIKELLSKNAITNEAILKELQAVANGIHKDLIPGYVRTIAEAIGIEKVFEAISSTAGATVFNKTEQSIIIGDLIKSTDEDSSRKDKKSNGKKNDPSTLIADVIDSNMTLEQKKQALGSISAHLTEQKYGNSWWPFNRERKIRKALEKAISELKGNESVRDGILNNLRVKLTGKASKSTGGVSVTGPNPKLDLANARFNPASGVSQLPTQLPTQLPIPPPVSPVKRLPVRPGPH